MKLSEKQLMVILVCFWVAMVIFLVGIVSGHRTKSMPSGVVTSVGVCDHSGLCGVVFTGDVHCLVRYPIVNQQATCEFYYP